MPSWRAGWEATKQAHHRILFFYGIEVVIAALGGIVGALVVPSNPSTLEQALYPGIGTVVGVVSGVLHMFLVFTGATFVRQRMTSMVTTIVKQTIDPVISPYPIPVVLPNANQGIPELKYLLKRGTELEPDVSPTGVDHWGWAQLEYWTQQWLNHVAESVWQYIPDHAAYITSDEGIRIQDEIPRYTGWQMSLAVRRVVFDHWLGRLRQVCSHIPELHTPDSLTGEGE